MPTPAPDPLRLYAACRELLDVVIEGYIANALPIPERRYVSDGPLVAWDCEQVTSYCENTFAGLSDAELPSATDAAGVRSARLYVEVVRKSPTFDAPAGLQQMPPPPPPERIDDNAKVALVDAIMLPWCVRAAKRAGTLPSCAGLIIDQWQAIGPAGSYVGSRLGVRVQLDVAYG